MKYRVIFQDREQIVNSHDILDAVKKAQRLQLEIPNSSLIVEEVSQYIPKITSSDLQISRYNILSDIAPYDEVSLELLTIDGKSKWVFYDGAHALDKDKEFVSPYSADVAAFDDIDSALDFWNK